jgi:UrcA family protein
MMLRLERRVSYSIMGILCGAGLLSAGMSAYAQEAVSQFADVPAGHSLSSTVAYRDLDLTTLAGRAELRRRVWVAAKQLCSRLDSTSEIAGVAPSCEDAARIKVIETERAIIAQAIPPGLKVARGAEAPTH